MKALICHKTQLHQVPKAHTFSEANRGSRSRNGLQCGARKRSHFGSNLTLSVGSPDCLGYKHFVRKNKSNIFCKSKNCFLHWKTLICLIPNWKYFLMFQFSTFFMFFLCNYQVRKHELFVKLSGIVSSNLHINAASFSGHFSDTFGQIWLFQMGYDEGTLTSFTSEKRYFNVSRNMFYKNFQKKLSKKNFFEQRRIDLNSSGIG